MRPKYRNFGFHQLIDRRPFLPDTYIRKPWLLRFLEITFFIGSVMLIIPVILADIEMLYKTPLFVLSAMLFSAGYLTAIESRWFWLVTIFTLVALVVAQSVVLYLWPNGISWFFLILTLVVAVLFAFLPRIKIYRQWVYDHDKIT